MFKIDSTLKQEALNYSTIMEILRCTEHRLEPLFEEAGKKFDLTTKMDDSGVAEDYCAFFNIDKNQLLLKYREVKEAFQTLRETDQIVKKGHMDYSPSLAETAEAPRFLFLRGNANLLMEEKAIALVGSRQASPESREKTRRLAKRLGDSNLIIVSGLAKGIDVSAHNAALDSHINTMAVIGTHLNQYYPYENREVQKEIERRGLIVSQFSPASQTERWHFPLRNGTMSGLTLATIIMEAGETSGALKQAEYALKQHRLVLIPKSAFDIKTISWPRKFEKRGAKVFDTLDDIFDALSESEILTRQEKPSIYQYTLSDMLAEGFEFESSIMPEEKGVPYVAFYGAN